MARRKATFGPCEECGETITAEVRADRPTPRFCGRRCSNRVTARNRETTKGYVIDQKGYKLIRAPNHPMASREGYVMEHRLVMAEAIGRHLTPDEVVHHRNGVKSDNRPENLELMEKRTHDRLSKPAPKPITCPHCQGKIGVSGRVRRVVAL